MVKDVEAAKAKERRRAALVLLLRYLHDNGYAESASALASESGTHLGSVDAADNVSLERIFLELEEHHLAKHGTLPKLFRRTGAPLEMEDSRPSSTGRGRGLGYDVASASGNGHNARAPATNAARRPRAAPPRRARSVDPSVLLATLPPARSTVSASRVSPSPLPRPPLRGRQRAPPPGRGRREPMCPPSPPSACPNSTNSPPPSDAISSSTTRACPGTPSRASITRSAFSRRLS